MELRAARFRDAVRLADRLRFEDAREISASWGLGVREGLMHCLLMSDRSFAVAGRAGPEALWGVTAVREAGLRVGVPWLLAGERLFNGDRGFLARSRSMVEHLLVEFDVLANLTEADNEAHLRWLAWCGFRRLRRHERYGASARPFVEFYRIGPGCRISEEALLTVLRRRSPTARAPDDPVVARLVNLAIPVLEGRSALDGAGTSELARILDALADPAAVAPRARQGCLRLLVELAQQATWNAASRGPRQQTPSRHSLPRELLASLASLADVVALAPGLGAADVLQAMAPPRPLPPPGRAAGAAAAGEQRQAEGAAALFWLLRHYVRRLTLEGRTDRAHGCRCWRASLGVDAQAVTAPLQVSRDELWSLLRDGQLANLLARDVGPEAHDPGAARRTLLAAPVRHAAVLAAMRGAVAPGSAAAGRWIRAAVGCGAAGRASGGIELVARRLSGPCRAPSPGTPAGAGAGGTGRARRPARAGAAGMAPRSAGPAGRGAGGDRRCRR